MAKAKTTDVLVLEALRRALAEPTPRPMHGTAANPGIFLSAAAPAKAAGEECLKQRLVRQVGEQRKGKKLIPLYAITPQGVMFLLERAEAPKLLGAALDATERAARAVSECAKTMDAVGRQVGELGHIVREAAARADPAPLLAKLLQASTPHTDASGSTNSDSTAIASKVSEFVRSAHAGKTPQPCSLAAVYRHVATQHPGLTIGRLHDAVRRLAAEKRIRLLPFTQALYQLSEPEYALIVGREVMFYVEAN